MLKNYAERSLSMRPPAKHYVQQLWDALDQTHSRSQVEPNERTVPLWSIAKRVVRCESGTQVYQSTVWRFAQEWLQCPCAPMPIKEDILEGAKALSDEITVLVNLPKGYHERAFRRTSCQESSERRRSRPSAIKRAKPTGPKKRRIDLLKSIQT